MMKHVSETSEKQLGNGRIFTFGTVSIWYNPERSFRRFARILNNRSVITEQVFRKESRNTALSDDLIQPFSTKTRRYIDMLSTHKTITLALMCALASTTVLTGCKDGAQQGQAAQRQMPPTEVTYVTAKTTDQTLQTTLTGRTSAYYEAEVRPQVNGVLVKKLFKDGSEVKAGQQLYQIDDAPYVAALKSAEASLAQANANLVKARADAKRSSELVKINAVSKQSDDAAQAALKSAVANQKAAEAAVATAKVNMQYTKVLSPISGRISRSEFTEGALMAAYQATPLTRVQQLDPIYVDVTQKAVLERVEELKPSFPEGMEVVIPFDTTPFISAALKGVIKTLFEAIVLVVVVMYLFLQNFRATLIPTIAVPVVLLGTFGALFVCGFSINMLTMFAMVLAIGLLVDDAIVVVENVERVMREDGTDPKTATIKSMGEIQSALVGIAMVLSAVFVPMAFFGGSTGVIYRQFSVTIVSAMALSVVVALTLTPALCATMLKPVNHEEHHGKGGFFGWFNRSFDAFTQSVKALIAKSIHGWSVMLVAYAAVVGLMVWGFKALPTSFMPQEDQGVLMMMSQLPDGATLERTDLEMKKIQQTFAKTEAKSVESVFVVRGFSFAGTGQNMALGFLKLRDWSERTTPDTSVAAIQGRTMGILMGHPDFKQASTFVFPLPPVPELGVADGFDLYIQDNTGGTHDKLMQYMGQFLMKANADPRLTMVRHNGMADTTQLKLVLDYEKLSALNLSIGEVNSAISTVLSGSYVNDYMDRGRVKQVWVMGNTGSRMQPEDILGWHVRNANGEMVPIGTFAKFEWSYGSPRLERFNGLPAVNIQGNPRAGVSSGQAMAAIEEIAKEVFPTGYEIAWNGVSYQEKAAGNQGPALFALSILVVFLCLAALYESWSVPIAVLLVVPCGVVGALGLTGALGMSNDIYFQVGLLTTIGLVSKNAILIVEFAKEYMEQGKDAIHAAEEAVRVRLRPILMTSLAFGLGVLPLAMAHGAGAGAQNAIGVGVLGGMLAGTFLCIAFVPVFYVLVDRFLGGKKRHEKNQTQQA